VKKITNCVALAALLTFATSTAHAVEFKFVNVFDVGNPNDSTGFGSVDSAYSIATTEVTNAQYAEFLNAIAKTDTYGVWNTTMSAEIMRSGFAGSYTYTAASGFASKPAMVISFFDAARFVNWLENGQPTGLQGAGTTETGTYTISDGISETRADGATFLLPSEDEWYKAAYYQPFAEGGDTDNYWLYPTQSNTAPLDEQPAGGANSANFDGILGGTTNVGAYTGTTSFYGGYDFGGNVFEWTEGLDGTGTRRIIRGGAWDGAVTFLSALSRTAVLPTGGSITPAGFGFRIAAILNYTPEPGTAVLTLTGVLLLMMFSGRQFQKRTR
jgi:formylglycine-generating enzyme required for sulfatase activity